MVPTTSESCSRANIDDSYTTSRSASTGLACLHYASVRRFPDPIVDRDLP